MAVRTAARYVRGGNLRLTQLHRRRAAVLAYSALRRGLSKLGFQVVVKSFYSPIPDLATLPADVWQRRSDLRGIDFDLDRQLAFLEEELAPFLHEFDPPLESRDAARFHLANPSYGPGDAETLYAFVRQLKPKRIIELGSGFTTLVISEAVQANARDGHSADLRVFDPFPGIASAETPGVRALVAQPAQEVPLETFDGLASGDMLVVDTTHTVKIGGDVNRIVLDVLPSLAPGVLVHFHDIFLPWEYPRTWAERYGLYWAEQYLVQAFLALNRDYEVVCALHALWREHPDRLGSLIPSLRGAGAPGAFWVRRVAADPA